MIGSAGLSGALAPRQRAALQPLLRVGRGVLIGDLGLREALHGDAEPGAVHHHEHRGEAAVLLADQPALGAVEVHHAGRIAVDAHLVLDRAAGDAVAVAERAVLVDAGIFGTRNSEMPFTPAGAPSMRASTRWMMLSARSCSPDEMKIFWPVIA